MSEHGERLRAMGCTALFATNDMLALGAMKWLLEHGVSVPRELSVMGFDDIDLSAMYAPSLTTISVDKAGMGREAVRLLDRLIEQEAAPAEGVELATGLIERGSTAPPGTGS
jgi:DNA-binding LacI/PurR family transcriptional regulator